ncbi:hypothetical protein [Massilia sp. NR 4-1]|uniref:hypothetical protein n=1 Tax=Massilia sp. NR 4-1 TaxID=1678028 RepID=UPI00067BAF2E|nr:hypothetical protein [Massilia sp. NR 4-1]AKU21212.1 hypothetical protein ACZ75_06685 [Massilia sp. NR 4-1]
MPSTLHRLYRFHNGVAGLLLFAGIICIPWYLWAAFEYLEHSYNSFYYAQVMGSVGKFMFPAIVYGFTFAYLNMKRTTNAIAATKPPGFTPGYEIRWGDKYFGVARDRSCIVIVDMPRQYAACKPLSFLQSYIIQQANVQSTLTLQFNDFDYSSLEFPVATKATEAIAAKLNFAAWS